MTEWDFLQQVHALKRDIDAWPIGDPVTAEIRRQWMARLGDLLERRAHDRVQERVATP